MGEQGEKGLKQNNKKEIRFSFSLSQGDKQKHLTVNTSLPQIAVEGGEKEKN